MPKTAAPTSTMGRSRGGAACVCAGSAGSVGLPGLTIRLRRSPRLARPGFGTADKRGGHTPAPRSTRHVITQSIVGSDGRPRRPCVAALPDGCPPPAVAGVETRLPAARNDRYGHGAVAEPCVDAACECGREAVTDDYDIVVAGAGHNSLVAAAYLGKAGLRCLVLEGREVIGGDTATEELTLPGFWSDTCSTAHNVLQASPTLRFDELGLAAHGLEYIHPDPVVHMPFPDGTSLTMWRDLDRTCEEFAAFSPRDADGYRRMMSEYDDVKGLFGAYRYTPIDWGPSLDERLADRADGMRWQRRRQMSAWEIIRTEFEDWHSRAFMLWMAFMTMQPPDHPATGLLAYSLAYGRQMHSWTLPKGGSRALPLALARVVTDQGGAVLTGKPVVRLVVEGERCVGVETADGERFGARRGVLSSIHPKHLVDMAPRQAWGEDFLFGVDTWQAGVSMFVAHYASTEPPRFAAADRELTPVAVGIAPSVERVLRIGGQFSRGAVEIDDPVLLVLCPTTADPTRAPEGSHTLKVIGFQPYELPEGPHAWDDCKDEVSRANLMQLRRFAPNLTDDVLLAAAVKSPLDLERINAHNWHGSCHGGAQGPAQSGRLRPVPGWAQHRMPIPGLYQTGSTTHPGASVSAGPGRNAAAVILKDLGTGLEAALA
ncbi:MAG: NAD(P)-binding protein [Nitriliruptorales bacterium]|nr:NAD(P)-binding protein [Nitriliruptorales bacterium]